MAIYVCTQDLAKYSTSLTNICLPRIQLLTKPIVALLIPIDRLRSSIYVYICLYTSTYVYLLLYTPIYVYIRLNPFSSWNQNSIYIRLYTSTYVYISPFYFSTDTNRPSHSSIYVYICLYTSTYVYLLLYTHIYVYMRLNTFS